MAYSTATGLDFGSRQIATDSHVLSLFSRLAARAHFPSHYYPKHVALFYQMVSLFRLSYQVFVADEQTGGEGGATVAAVLMERYVLGDGSAKALDTTAALGDFAGGIKEAVAALRQRGQPAFSLGVAGACGAPQELQRQQLVAIKASDDLLVEHHLQPMDDIGLSEWLPNNETNANSPVVVLVPSRLKDALLHNALQGHLPP